MKVQSLVFAAALAAMASLASAGVAEDAPCGEVTYSDLNLKSSAGAAAFRARVDREVVVLSGGHDTQYRPDVLAARQRARVQADALIRAAA